MFGVLKLCGRVERFPGLQDCSRHRRGFCSLWAAVRHADPSSRGGFQSSTCSLDRLASPSPRSVSASGRPRCFTSAAFQRVSESSVLTAVKDARTCGTKTLGRRWGSSSAREDPSKIVSSPHPDVEMPDVSFAEAMFASFQQHGHRVATIDFSTGREMTYNQLMDQAARVAGSLHGLGFRKGDVIMSYLNNCSEYAIIFLACGLLGTVLTTANPAYTAGELARQMEQSGCRALVTASQFVPTATQALASSSELSDKIKHRWVVGGSASGFQEFSALAAKGAPRCPDVALDPRTDVLALPYSSGTTGLPKGVLLTHRNILANVWQLQSVLPLVPGEDRMLGVLPFYHIYGMVVVQFNCLNQGASLVTLLRYQPEDFLTAIEKHRLTVLPLVPPLMIFLAKEPTVETRDLSSVHTILSGAAPLSRQVTEEVSGKVGASLPQIYGLTELSPVSNYNTPPIKSGTIGPLVPNTLGKIVDVETGEALGRNKVGELCIKGPQVMKGYLNNQKATDDIIRDGWVHTGDVGFFDDDGYVTITDRIKELIKYKGFQVAPAELEAVILSHPAVKDAAVVGIPDDVSGEVPRAFVALKPGLDVPLNEIADFVKQHVAPHKQLRGGVVAVDEIPKTASGKILRRLLVPKGTDGK